MSFLAENEPRQEFAADSIRSPAFGPPLADKVQLWGFTAKKCSTDNCEVEKIECSNHLIRNFCYSVEELAKKGDGYRKLQRGATKGLRMNIQRNIMKMRTAVVKASEHWRTDDGPVHQRVLKLKRDIINTPRHTFGDGITRSVRDTFATESESLLKQIWFGCYSK